LGLVAGAYFSLRSPVPKPTHTVGASPSTPGWGEVASGPGLRTLSHSTSCGGSRVGAEIGLGNPLRPRSTYLDCAEPDSPSSALRVRP